MLDQFELFEIKKWEDDYGAGSNQLVQDFLNASKSAIQKLERKKRIRSLSIIGLYSVSLIIAVLGITGWFNPYLYPPAQVMRDYWVDIPAGMFLLGSSEIDARADIDEFPQKIIYLNEFQIGHHEVTNEQWNQCVNAGGCNGGIRDGPSDLPVVSVSWQDANDFCAWAGGRLPTEAEWEKAARGGIEIPLADGTMIENPNPDRLYPWGDETPECDLGSPFGANAFLCEQGSVISVKSFSANPYGLYDMAGNAWEWVSDWYGKDYYETLSSGTRNPTGPVPLIISEDESDESDVSGFRVLRGGSFDVNAFNGRVANRAWNIPVDVSSDIGFRCAR